MTDQRVIASKQFLSEAFAAQLPLQSLKLTIGRMLDELEQYFLAHPDEIPDVSTFELINSRSEFGVEFSMRMKAEVLPDDVIDVLKAVALVLHEKEKSTT